MDFIALVLIGGLLVITPHVAGVLVKQTFNCSKSTSTFIVPLDVHTLDIDMTGAGGGYDPMIVGYTPGRGGRMQGKLAGEIVFSRY